MIKNLSCCVALVLIANCLVFAQNDSERVVAALQGYAAAVQSKDMNKIEKQVVTTDDFAMFEGGHINWGWTDYRDHHLGPELKQFLEFQYGYANIKAHVMGEMAYATLKYNIAIKTKEREMSGEGLATAILSKENGDWKILHMHTSRIPARRNKS
jgi:ketosteroid isomerase-like protein